MIEGMMTGRITEAELARDPHAVLEKVQQGREVISAARRSPACGGNQLASSQRTAHHRNPA